MYSPDMQAQVTYDGNGATALGATIPSFTVPAGMDRLLVISVCAIPNGPITVEFNGISATFAVTNTSGAPGIASIYYIPLGTGAAITANVNLTGGSDIILGAASFENVDQANPLGNTNEAEFTSTDNPSLIVSTTPGNLVYDKIFSEFDEDPSPDASQTPVFFNTDNSSDAGSSFKIATGASTTMSQTLAQVTNSWAYSVAEFNAASTTQPAAIPTMSEWGLFLFGLIIFTVAVVSLYNYKKGASAAK